MDRLIVIDDEPELGRFVGRVGESIGYEVKVTTRVHDFKEQVTQWKPTVIIMDLAMPEADGLELLRWLAAESFRAQVVIMSGFDARVVEAAKQIGQERGLNICFTFNKPVRVQDLKEKLEALKRVKDESLDEADLERALNARELFLQYQPKVELKTGALKGVEALVRWKHPVRGVVPPDQFISLAEMSGLIDKLTDFVLAESIYQQKFWAQQGLDIHVAVNLSPVNLRAENLVEHIGMLCQSENVSPDRLVLEITESTAMSNALQSLDILTRLRLKGFRLSIDDFGTGFSSLSRLRRLPVTEIKIDRTFVIESLTSSDALIIVKTVIGLARNMNLTVIAEGVETMEHYKMLEELGCDLGQGYGIAKPMEAGELLMWNAKRQEQAKTAATPSMMSAPTPEALVAAKAAKAAG